MLKLINYRLINPSLISLSKCYSTNNSYSTLKCHNNNGLAILEMHNMKANVCTFDFLTHLKTQFNLIERQFSALILTSSLKCFSSGADLNEFYSRKRVNDYIKCFEETCIALYSLPMPTIAAINGHAIAGGCVLANACDYRFIVKNCKIGLNESVLGLSVPYFVYKWPIQILGRKLGTRVCLEGKLFNSEEALGIGWVDGVAEDQSQLMTLCLNKMEDLMKIPAKAYGSIKKLSQLEFFKSNNEFGDRVRAEFVNVVNDDKTNVIIGNLLNSLSKKNK